MIAVSADTAARGRGMAPACWVCKICVNELRLETRQTEAQHQQQAAKAKFWFPSRSKLRLHISHIDVRRVERCRQLVHACRRPNIGEYVHACMRLPTAIQQCLIQRVLLLL